MRRSSFRLVIAAAGLWSGLLGILAAETATAGGGNLLVASEGTNSVLRFDALTGQFQNTFIAPGSGGLNDLQGITIGPDGNLYAASHGSGSIKRYNGHTGAYLGDFVTSGSGGLGSPDTVLFGPDGNLYASDRFTGRILRFNGQTGAFVDTFVQDGRLDGFLSFAFHDGSLYASMFNCCASQRILRFNGTTGAFIEAFAAGQPTKDAAYAGITFGPDGLLYTSRFQLIPADNANRVERFDPATGQFVDLFVQAGNDRLAAPRDLMFGPDGNLYVASENGGLASNAVLRYDGKTGTFIDKFASNPLLDNPTSFVFVVPEPGTWSMLGIGLAAVALTLRQRRAVVRDQPYAVGIGPDGNRRSGV